MSSHCIFCAAPSTSQSDDGSGTTVENQFQGIFVLQNILGFGKTQINKYTTVEEFGSRHYPDVCEPCEKQVRECLEAVTEIAKLQNKVTRISTSLKDQIYDTKEEKGEGANSMWGRIRLDVLLMMAGGDDFTNEQRSQRNVGQPYEPQAGNYSTFPGISEVGNGEASQQFFPEGSNADFNFSDDDDGLDDEEANFGDPLIEVEEKVLPQSLDIDTEEKINVEEPSILERRSSRIHLSSNASKLETLSDKDEELNSQELASNSDQQLRRQPDGFYHCPHCPKTFSCHRSRNSHKVIHSQKFVCKVCNHGYTTATKFRIHLRDNRCARVLGKNRPCRHCGKHFSNLNKHEGACEMRKQRKQTGWEQFLK